MGVGQSIVWVWMCLHQSCREYEDEAGRPHHFREGAAPEHLPEGSGAQGAGGLVPSLAQIPLRGAASLQPQGDPMTTLAPMRAEAYPAFFEEAVAFYAEENIAAGCWPAEEAPGLSRGETERLLSQGLETPDHHLFEIFAAGGQEPVGYAWVAAMPMGHAKVA